MQTVELSLTLCDLGHVDYSVSFEEGAVDGRVDELLGLPVEVHGCYVVDEGCLAPEVGGV